MAMVLTRLLGRGVSIPFVDDIAAFGWGLANGLLLMKTRWGAWFMLFGNVAVVTLGFTTPIPAGLKHGAEAMLGFLIGVIAG